MSRIRKGYETRFRSLLGQLHARRPEHGLRWLLARADNLRRGQTISDADALARVHEELLRKVQQHRARKPASAPTPKHGTTPNPPVFLCDAGLGGLARWLRAAGHEALWNPAIADDELLQQARQLGAVLLTTDSMLMERRLLRDGIIPALWLPPTLTMAEQLALVFHELGLRPRAPRCMSCGGELRRVQKESVLDRIPPKTLRWQNEYFVCVRCDKLFWHGTHWRKIARQLERLETGPPGTS